MLFVVLVVRKKARRMMVVTLLVALSIYDSLSDILIVAELEPNRTFVAFEKVL
jgi:hypothetical protein